MQPKGAQEQIADDRVRNSQVTHSVWDRGPVTLAENLRKPNDQLINALYLGVLSRYPSDGEMRTAVNLLLTAPSQAADALGVRACVVRSTATSPNVGL